MKKLIIALVALLVLIAIFAVGISVTTFNLLEEQEHVAYTEVLSSDVPTMYFYYRDGCGYCESAEPQLTKMAKVMNGRDDIDLKLVDVYSEENLDEKGEAIPLITQTEAVTYSTDPATMITPEDIKFVGTPGMIYVEDGNVVKYGVGESIFDVMEYVNDTYSLGVTLNRSVYGE